VDVRRKGALAAGVPESGVLRRVTGRLRPAARVRHEELNRFGADRGGSGQATSGEATADLHVGAQRRGQ
jgi:hypothetical protein